MSWDKITEKQNLKTIDIDDKNIHQILKIINNEDMSVPVAINNCLSNIVSFIEALYNRIRRSRCCRMSSNIQH